MPELSLRLPAILTLTLTLALCAALGVACTNRLGPLPPPPVGGTTSPPIPMGTGTGGVMTALRSDGGGGISGTDAAVQCFIPLANTGCATRYMDQLQNDPACRQGASGSQAGTCGPYLVWFSGASNALGSQICVYDGTQLTLVSATVCSNIVSYCNLDTCASAGHGIDTSTICDVSTLPLVCPNTGGPIVDGGSADGGDDDASGGALCAQPSLDTPWPVLPGCLGNTILTTRCPLPGRINDPMYPAFVGCCPADAPFACGNGTPNSCFSTAEEAAASCGSACIQCTAFSNGPIPP